MKAKLNIMNLIKIMAEREITQKKLSDLSGVSRQTICLSFARKSCAWVTAGKLAEGLGVDVSDVIMEED